MYICLFFFQAEDGIRDADVTGVQTCALPIFPTCEGGLEHVAGVQRAAGSTCSNERMEFINKEDDVLVFLQFVHHGLHALLERSEERRVGKECSSGWWPTREHKTRQDGTRSRM